MARPDWWIVSEVAKRMGHGKAFAYASPAEIFAEHAALSAFENAGTRAFDIGAFAGIDRRSYERMQPFQWPRPRPRSAGDTRFFAHGGFYTPDRKARMVAVAAAPHSEPGADFPFTLNTGRVRDHWHTMTRTGKSKRLSRHLAEPYAEISPEDARRLGIGDADLVHVESAQGAVLVRALVSKRQAKESVFVPVHWNDQFASNARIGRLVPSVTDPHSGQPASKRIPARVARFQAAAYGFAVLRARPGSLEADYWALAACDGGFRLELALAKASPEWLGFANTLFGAHSGTETLAFQDRGSGLYRFACFDGETLIGALFLGPEPVAVSRAWASELLAKPHAGMRARMGVIAGRPGFGFTDSGATICTCFGVGANQIVAAVIGGCTTTDAIGRALKAGTNCGSCRGEISRLIEDHRHDRPAATKNVQN
jgi:assimilatory nitrate reductase catalytic subunit